MTSRRYQSMNSRFHVNRREFLAAGGVVGAGLLLGTPSLIADEKHESGKPERPKTNVDEALAAPRGKHSLPGAFPGKVVEVCDEKAMIDNQPVAEVVKAMFASGLEKMTGKNPKESWGLFFNRDDIVGIKVNPVGAGLISTRFEVVDAIIEWLESGGISRGNVIIWDRFDYMLADAGFTVERFPGVGIEGLQTMDEAAFSDETSDDSKWLDKDGIHISAPNFDTEAYYWVDVDGPKDKGYLNQHVFNGKHSYFGKLLTKKLTKIINVPTFKNTGNGISMATKNMGYGAVCNTGRLHNPLFFDVCTEVLAFPCVRDKMVLNVTDGLRGQYDGGPGPNAEFIYDYNTIFLATDPFALDMVCHQLMVEKRKSMKVDVNEHPRFTEYLRYAESLGLGVVDSDKIEHVKV